MSLKNKQFDEFPDFSNKNLIEIYSNEIFWDHQVFALILLPALLLILLLLLLFLTFG